MKSFMVLAVLLMLGPDGTSVQAQEAELLRWKFNEGDKFLVVLGQSTEISSSLDEKKVRSTQQQVHVWMEWQVAQVTDDLAHMNWRFVRVKSSFANSGGETEGSEVSFDTDQPKPEDAPAARLWRRVHTLLNQPFQVTMDTRGAIQQVTIPDETTDALRDFSGAMRVRQLMTEDGIREILGETAIQLPESPVTVGQSWTSERTFEIALGKIKQKTTYVIRGPDEDSPDEDRPDEDSPDEDRPDEDRPDEDSPDGEQRIELTGEATVSDFVDDGRPRLEIQDQQTSGTLLFDTQAGLMRSGQLTSEMKTLTPYRDMNILGEMRTELTLRIEKQ